MRGGDELLWEACDFRGARRAGRVGMGAAPGRAGCFCRGYASACRVTHGAQPDAFDAGKWHACLRKIFSTNVSQHSCWIWARGRLGS